MSILSNRFSDAKHEAGDYTKAVLGLLGDREPIAVLEKTPAEVTRRLEGLSRDDLGRPEAQNKWSIAQVVLHLADSEIVWGYRLRRILAEDRPAIHGYDQDQWAARLHYERADASIALAELRALRAGHVRMVRELGPLERQRVGVHSERGEESVEHLIRMYAGHDLLHLNQLDRIRKTLRLEQPA